MTKSTLLAGAAFSLMLATPAQADCVDMNEYVYPDGEVEFAQRAGQVLSTAFRPPTPYRWIAFYPSVRNVETADCSSDGRSRTIRRQRAEVTTQISYGKLGTDPETRYDVFITANRLAQKPSRFSHVETIQIGTPNATGPVGRIYNVTIEIVPMPGRSNANATGPIPPEDLEIVRGLIDEGAIQAMMEGSLPELEEARAQRTSHLAEVERVSNAHNLAYARGEDVAGSGQSSSSQSSSSSQGAQQQPRPKPRPSLPGILGRIPGFR